jgi:dipeptidyl-peptidase-4
VLSVAGRPLTGPQLHVRAVLDVADGDVLVSASAGAAAEAPETGEIHVYRVGEPGVERMTTEPGVHTAVRSGGVTVLSSAVPGKPGTTVRVLRDGRPVATVASYAEDPRLALRLTLTEAQVTDPAPGAYGAEPLPAASNPAQRGARAHAGARRIPCAVLLPSWYREGDGPLPVLMDPYGGPHGQMVLAAQNPFLVSQWFAEQGFAVVVADGRGTPGHSPEWEKSIRDDVAAIALQDQVDAVRALAGRFPLDLGRVAIRGWSFGGYLAALAALRRPDVFHAAVVGAPVTDLRLYDTHYEERYLGLPDEQPEVYRRNSLIDDQGLVDPAEPHRPMMIIHGLADDNVVVAHSLRLSSALLAAGRPHEVLPLSGVTHMASQEEVAENLLLFQRDFLRRSLGLTVAERRA